MNIKKVKTLGTKRVWFCGCEVEKDGVNYDRSWEEIGKQHEIIFNKNELRKEYICHLRKIVGVEIYKVIAYHD